jgi:hypothetical protein
MVPPLPPPPPQRSSGSTLLAKAPHCTVPNSMQRPDATYCCTTQTLSARQPQPVWCGPRRRREVKGNCPMSQRTIRGKPFSFRFRWVMRAKNLCTGSFRPRGLDVHFTNAASDRPPGEGCARSGSSSARDRGVSPDIW